MKRQLSRKTVTELLERFSKIIRASVAEEFADSAVEVLKTDFETAVHSLDVDALARDYTADGPNELRRRRQARQERKDARGSTLVRAHKEWSSTKKNIFYGTETARVAPA